MSRLFFLALSFSTLMFFSSIAADSCLRDGVGAQFPCDDIFYGGSGSDSVRVSSHFPSSYYSSDRYDIFSSDDSLGYSLGFGLNGLDRNFDRVPGVNNDLEPGLFIEPEGEDGLFCPSPKRWLRKLVKAYNRHKYRKCLDYTRIYETTLLSRGLLPFALGHINKHQRRIIRSYRSASKKCLRHCRSSSCSSSSYGSSGTSNCTDRSTEILTRAMARTMALDRTGDVLRPDAAKESDVVFDSHWELASVNYESGEPGECKKILKHLSDESNRSGLAFDATLECEDDDSAKELAKKILSDREECDAGEFKEELLFNLLMR